MQLFNLNGVRTRKGAHLEYSVDLIKAAYLLVEQGS